MSKLTKHLFVTFLGLFSLWNVQAQSPNLVKFSTTSADGKYSTGSTIEIMAEFDNWLGIGSTVDVVLNTGKTVTLTFNPKKASDLLDADWGVPGVKNATDYTYTDYSNYYGFTCILELEGKGDYGANKGLMVLSGGFDNYEATGNDDFVVVDANGKEVKLGYGQRRTNYLNDEVRWVIETQDGGLLLGGEFINFMGNANYDYLVKLKGDFSIDTDFMNKLTASNTQPALNGLVGAIAADFGRPGFCMAEDTDGSIFVMGEFTTVGGVARRGVVKLNADGSVNSDFNAGFTNATARGSSVAIDGDYIWIGASRSGHWTGTAYQALDKRDKTTGARAPGFTLQNFGTCYGILGIRVMPEPTDPDTPGPGGVLVTGKYISAGSSTSDHIASIQDDGSITPSGTGAGKFNVDGMFNNFWAVDGMDIMKGKIWCGVHECNGTAPSGDRYFEGALVVLNLDGTAATSFNGMFNNNSATIYEGFNYGAYDILSVARNSHDQLLVGGNYASLMNSAITSGDDDFITRLTFNRAYGTYTISADDLVGRLDVVGISSANVTGAFGDAGGVISLDEIDPDDAFTNNHAISVNMPIVMAENTFNTTWDVKAGESVQIPLDASLSYDFYVDWGDGKMINSVHYADVPNIKRFTGTGSALSVKYTYANAGVYTIRIVGAGEDANKNSNGKGFPRILFNGGAAGQQIDKILSVEQWGNTQWAAMSSAFKGCSNLVLNATDSPDLNSVTDMSSMFEGTPMNSDLSAWDVSKVQNMTDLFKNASAYNNGGVPLSWGDKTAAVVSMYGLFEGATAFNQSVDGWNVSKVQTMMTMFSGATAFNNGDTGNNQANPIVWSWATTPALTVMNGMFNGATAFNQSLANFKTASVQNFNAAFQNATLFNQDLSAWDVSAATSMDAMFNGATAFDQNLASWKISALTSADLMFQNATLSLDNYDALLIGWCAQVQAATAKQNVKFHGGNSTWCMGEAAREILINKGWGDADNANNSYVNTDVTGIIDGGSNCSGQFITQWKVPASKTITIQRYGNKGDAMTVSWGDGAVDYNVTGEPTHTYGSNYTAGDIVTIKMSGGVSMRWGSTTEDIQYLQKVMKFGTIQWSSMERMFYGAKEMNFDADVDVPDLSKVSTMNYLFNGCTVFNSPIDNWDVSTITDMHGAFWYAKAFNQSLNNWNVSAATNMSNMFCGAIAFNQDLSAWDVSKVTSMNFMFQDATTFNQDLSDWNVSAVTSMNNMFSGTTAFNQNLSAWKISALTSASNMFTSVTLSVENYDALLISWSKQVNLGTANKNVKFHGGKSQYCDGKAARELLIDKGWGDGVLGAANSTYTDIVDGGSSAPNISATLVETPAIFQGAEQAKIILAKTLSGVTYYAKALPSGTVVSVTGNPSANVTLTMGAINVDTDYQLWAGASCESYFENQTIKVYPQADLAEAVVTLTTSADKKAANGTDAHQIEVVVKDLLGNLMPNAEVQFESTANVSFSSASVYTDANGVATTSATSTKVGTYTTSVSVISHNPEDSGNTVGGVITHSSNPVSYTFGAGIPTSASLEWLTSSETSLMADNLEYHLFRVTLKDANGNLVPDAEVRFNATTDVRFWQNVSDATTAGDATSGLKTNSEGQMEVHASTKKAWTNFTTSIEFYNGTAWVAAASTSAYSFVAGPIEANMSTVTANPTPQIVGDDIELAITLLDAYGNPCRGETAIFHLPTLQEDGSAATSVTYDGTYGKVQKVVDNNGVATVKATSTLVGKFTTAGAVIFMGNESAKTIPVDYEFTPATAGGVALVLERNNSEANGSQYNQIIGTVTDAFGNLLEGVNVKIPADANINWGSGLNTDHIVASDANGVVVFNGTSSVAGTYSTTVYYETSTDVYTEVIPAITHKFLPGTASFSNSTIVLDPPSQVADGSSYITVTVTLKDVSNNPVNAGQAYFYKTANVKAEMITGTASSDTDTEKFIITTGSDGVAEFKITSTVAKKYATQCGVYDAAVSGGGNEGAVYLAEYEFTPGAPSAAKSVVSVIQDKQVAGVNPDKLRVKLFDAQNNAITTLSAASAVTFEATTNVSINGGTAGDAYVYSLAKDDAGTFDIPVSSTVASTFSTAVKIGADALSGSPASYSFVPGVPTVGNSSYTITDNGALIGGSEKVKITVTLKDANGNVTPNINVGLQNNHKTEGFLDLGGGTQKDGMKVTNASGQVVFEASSSKIGRVNSEIAFNLTDWSLAGFAGNYIATTASPASYYFVDPYTTVDATSNMAVRAKWYVLTSQSLATSHDQAKALSAAGASAWYLSGTESISSITIDDLSGVKTGVAGPYAVKFTATGSDAKTVERANVVASVIDAKTSYDETAELAIRAMSYTLSHELAVSHDAATALTDACTKAWSLSDWTKNDLLATTVPASGHISDINGHSASASTLVTYPLDITVTDGAKNFTRSVNVLVFADKDWFITTWQVEAGETITIPTKGGGYDFSINWGDGYGVEELSGSGPFSKTYSTAGTVTIKIAGTFPYIWFNGGDEGQQVDKIWSIEQWGTIKWKGMESAFDGCSNMVINNPLTVGAPDLSEAKTLREMFKNASNVNSASISAWNVTTITDMNSMFYGATSFNQSLSLWNVSAVTSMGSMFYNASAFNQDLSAWDVSKVTSMSSMFMGASAYNNGNSALAWDVSKVTSMTNMFNKATSFDQNIGGWNISALTNAQGMFKDAQLSVANYDALLMGWEAQVAAGNEASTVKFHGGLSEYCAGETARASLIAKGWGDGTAGGDAANNMDGTTGIADGGSGKPIKTFTFEEDVVQACINVEENIILSSSETTVEYQLYNKADDSQVGAPVVGTGDVISFPVTIATAGTTNYYVEAAHTDFTCTEILTDEVEVVTAPVSVGGILAVKDGSSNNVCVGTNSKELELTGHVGSVERWESSVKGDFTDMVEIANTTDTYTAIDLAESTTFRALVQSGECSETYSSEITINVFEAVNTGSLAITGDALICNGYTTQLGIGEYGSSSIVRWESSVKGDFTDKVEITNTFDTYTTSALSTSTSFRVVLTNGVCDDQYSNIVTVQVNDCDRGDAPDSYFTTVANNGPVHYAPQASSNVYIGTVAPDSEVDGIPTSDASGDDATGDDEDGLMLSYSTDQSTIVLSNINVVNNLGKDALLYMWIDINQNGTFEMTESSNAKVKSGTHAVSLETANYNYGIKLGSYMVRLRVGSVLSEVSSPTGLAIDGEVEDHLICLRPAELKVAAAQMQICDEQASINLNECIAYEAQAGYEVNWSTADGTPINASDVPSYDVTGMNLREILVLNYTVTESYCGVEMSATGKLYVEKVNEIEIGDKELTICVADAANLNLSNLLGTAVSGTWTANTAGAGAHLSGNRFAGDAAYDDVTGGNQVFEFTFTPANNACMTTTPKVTITIEQTL
ncbi:MAG: BspA family leucine-rich repeat surface protein [Mangrovibacterium sp.]